VGDGEVGKSGSQLSSDEVWFVMEEVSGTKSEVEIDKDVFRRGRHDCQPAKSTAPTKIVDEVDACARNRKVRLKRRKERTKDFHVRRKEPPKLRMPCCITQSAAA
jgi:hypothetical protein